MNNILVSLLFLLLAAPYSVGNAVAASASSDVQSMNRWTTDFGPMSLRVSPNSDQVAGDYPDYSGKIYGMITEGQRIEAVWVQPTSKRSCATTRHDSNYWGTVQWQVVEGKYLQGQWAYCDDPIGSGGAWNGGTPSVGSAFAKIFSTLVSVATQTAGATLGTDVGGQLAAMALNEASSAVQSGIHDAATSPSYSDDAFESSDESARNDVANIPAYPRPRRN